MFCELSNRIGQMETDVSMAENGRNQRAELSPRQVPAYGISEAAHYLQLPTATLRSWVRGRRYPLAGGSTGFFRPVIVLPDPKQSLLSFINLVEAHALDAIRRTHGIELRKVRTAIQYLREYLGVKHPLAYRQMLTDGCDLFVKRYAELINVSQEGQLGMADILMAYLRRVEWDETGLALRLYPFTRKKELDEPKFIVIDPYVSFGKPVLVGTGVPTSVVAERYKAGESVDELADDYGLGRTSVEEAIRCELRAA